MGEADWKGFLHYLPYSEEDEKLGMFCTNAGHCDIPPRTVYPLRKHEHPAPFRPVAEGRVLSEFQIVYISAGEGSFTAEGINRRVTPGSILLILPGMMHRYAPDFETGWSEYWVGFNGRYFTGLHKEGILSRDHVFFQIGLYDSFFLTFNHIFDEVKTQQPLFQLKACIGIMELLGEILSRERRMEQPNYYQKIVEKAKYLMETNIYGAINLAYISDKIGVSTSRFIDVFKTYTSMTPYQYYMHIKLHRAENLLENDVPVAEVAHRMGFEDQSYFSRLFKHKTGVSPSRWKRLAREQP
ncbi:MAG: AraC family transcriptional regulator [Treponema sp.]|jgi:AraC-like DNA-binding protein|nr:AraC family transcriptional regulator [Treponema sp.]